MNNQFIAVPGCIKTFACPLPDDEKGHKRLYVRVEPGGEIPLHTHQCNSGMGITFGSADTIGKVNNQRALPGQYIYKEALQPHGFTNIAPEGFEFISTSNNLGILQQNNTFEIDYL